MGDANGRPTRSMGAFIAPTASFAKIHGKYHR
jgi:hypothetical protein